MEVLVTARDTDTLAMTDGFLVPDIMLHYVEVKALEYCWSKDGEQRSPQMQKYCAMRYARGVQTVQRWMDAMDVETGINKLQKMVAG